jgi:hypothetical protein
MWVYVSSVLCVRKSRLSAVSLCQVTFGWNRVMPDQLSALIPKKKRKGAFLIPEIGLGTDLLCYSSKKKSYSHIPLPRRTRPRPLMLITAVLSCYFHPPAHSQAMFSLFKFVMKSATQNSGFVKKSACADRRDLSISCRC